MCLKLKKKSVGVLRDVAILDYDNITIGFYISKWKFEF